MMMSLKIFTGLLAMWVFLGVSTDFHFPGCLGEPHHRPPHPPPDIFDQIREYFLGVTTRPISTTTPTPKPDRKIKTTKPASTTKGNAHKETTTKHPENSTVTSTGTTNVTATTTEIHEMTTKATEKPQTPTASEALPTTTTPAAAIATSSP